MNPDPATVSTKPDPNSAVPVGESELIEGVGLLFPPPVPLELPALPPHPERRPKEMQAAIESTPKKDTPILLWFLI
jgi:hypothetical protein